MGTNYITFSVVLSRFALSLSHSLVTRRYITLATYFYDLAARWLECNGLLLYSLSAVPRYRNIYSCRSSLVDTATQKWIVQLGLGIGKSLLSSVAVAAPPLLPYPYFLPLAVQRFPGDFTNILPLSSVAPPLVCPLWPVGAALAHSGNTDGIQRHFVNLANEMRLYEHSLFLE